MFPISKHPRIALARPVTGTSTTGAPASFQMALLDRAHQQAAVAALGQAALSGVDFSTLLEQAALFLAQTLSIDFASIHELQKDGGTLRMVAGFGWESGVVGTVTTGTEPPTLASQVLNSSEPVILHEARGMAAGMLPEYFRTHGVDSGISLMIPNGSAPWGILEAHSRSRRSFAEDDFHFLQSMANVISTAYSRQQAEAEREHLAAFVQYNPNPVIELDADAASTYCNDAARLVAGALAKQHPGELLPARCAEIVRQCLTQDMNVLHEVVEVSGRTLSWSFFPIASIGRVHGYAVDITERMSLEAQLRQSQKMEAIGQLAAGVAHDFNNILPIMQGLVRRLGLSASQEQNVMLDQLFDTTERAASLTRQLLAFSRKQVMQLHVLSLGEVVAQMSKLLQRLIGENITLIVEHTEGVPPLEADASMMEQIVLNLAVNARDAMPHNGQLYIRTDTAEVEFEGVTSTWVRLRVRDTGCGIPPEVLPRIFEPFFTTKEVGKGTGLGLATVFGVVKQHGGLLEVESAVNEGTTFSIFLPPTTKTLETERTVKAQSVLKRGAGETILLVEDEPILRELAQAILVDAGYKVLEAEQSEEALSVWQQHEGKIDLLLTDMVLPGGMTGRELAAQLQKLKPQLKIIYSTGYSQDVVESDGATAGFLQKPYPPETLMRTVRACLDAV